MPILPIPFLEHGSICFRWIGGVAKSGGSINRRGDGVPGNMRGRHRLTGGAGRRTGRMMVFDIAGGRMGGK